MEINNRDELCNILVFKSDCLLRDGKEYTVISADKDIFIIAPVVYYNDKDGREVHSIKYENMEAYSNIKNINSLEQLNFTLI